MSDTDSLMYEMFTKDLYNDIQSNLDYPDSSGPQLKVRIIESPDNRIYEY